MMRPISSLFSSSSSNQPKQPRAAPAARPHPAHLLASASRSSIASPSPPLHSRPFDPLKPSKAASQRRPILGPLPRDVVVLVLAWVPVPDLPAVALGSRALAGAVRDDGVWQGRWEAVRERGEVLEGKKARMGQGPRRVESDRRPPVPPPPPAGTTIPKLPPPSISNNLLDFDTPALFVPSSAPESLLDFDSPAPPPVPSTPYHLYRMHHLRLLPRARSLTSPTLPAFLTDPNPSNTARVFLRLDSFLAPAVQPSRDCRALRDALERARTWFSSRLLREFQAAEERVEGRAMREIAEAAWLLCGEDQGKYEVARVWIAGRKVFQELEQWNALDNISTTTTGIPTLNFEPMTTFTSHVTSTLLSSGSLARKIFPRQADVLLSLLARISTDVLAAYAEPLLSHARTLSPLTHARATAAAFAQSLTLVDAVMKIADDEHVPLGERGRVTRTRAEDVLYRMAEPWMDPYLSTEVEGLREALESVCDEWNKLIDTTHAPTFVPTSNPATLKRSALSGLQAALLLPVTIVPLTASYTLSALRTTGSATVQGLQMLDPRRWQAGVQAIPAGTQALPVVTAEVEAEGDVVFEAPEEEEAKAKVVEAREETARSAEPRTSKGSTEGDNECDKLQMLVSLDIALQLIHASRETLKRVQTFRGFPGRYGYRVKDTIEECFIILLHALGQRHLVPGFAKATDEMRAFLPAEHEHTATHSVAPLIQFFELTHLGDTIQSMVQVYFDQELVIDKTDFLNDVVREKKKFDLGLDEAVAAGLDAGIGVLMAQVEHIITRLQGPLDFCPAPGTTVELGPTRACREAIECLKMHCDLLRGVADKHVLEVFYSEIGVRLQSIVQKHLKMHIISIEGGFQVIADLNAYHAFVASLRQQVVTENFSALKMVGHVFIVSDAKDLGQIVRDVSRYRGQFPPDEVYEFIKRRADWKRIEKEVDKAMYGWSSREDCVIS